MFMSWLYQQMFRGLDIEAEKCFHFKWHSVGVFLLFLSGGRSKYIKWGVTILTASRNMIEIRYLRKILWCLYSSWYISIHSLRYAVQVTNIEYIYIVYERIISIYRSMIHSCKQMFILSIVRVGKYTFTRLTCDCQKN